MGEAAGYPIAIPGLATTQAAVWRGIGAGEPGRVLDRLRGVALSLRALL